MKNLFAGTFLFLAGAALSADYTTDSAQFKAAIDLKGGSVTQLQNYYKKPLILPDEQSFTDKIFSVKDGKVLIEKFTDYEYSVVSSNYNYRKNADITLSAKGSLCFDWLRVTKKYNFNWNKTFFTIDYTLKNISDQPQQAGVWIQTFLNVGDGYVHFHPRNGKIVEITHPGSATSNEWSFTPGVALAGTAGKNTAYGMVLSIKPANLFGGTYSWSGNKQNKPLSSLELMTKVMEIAPRSEVKFTLTAHYNGNVRNYLKKLIKSPEYKIAEPVLQDFSKFTYTTPQLNTLKMPHRYVDVQLPRQFHDSIRAITIPADEKIEKAAAYIVSNKTIDIDQPLACKLVRQPDGSSRLLFMVPGLNSRGSLYSKIENGLLYDVITSRHFYLKGKKDLTIRIALDAPADPPVLDADKPELFYNGDFEKPNAANTFADGNLWYDLTRKRKVTFWEKCGKDSSYGIRLKRETPKGTAAYVSEFIAEPARKYTVSADIKCENHDKKYIICYVDCFDAKEKFIAKSKIVYSNSTVSHDWKRVSKTFSIPENAVKLRVAFQVSPASAENSMLIDNVSLVPDDFSFKAKPALEAAREDAIYSGYTPLANLEKISHEYVTPHEKWFKPAAFQLPKLLYCCAIIGTNEDASRREIVELAQRLDLAYDFIPLLPVASNMGGHGTFAVSNVHLGNKITSYTLERFRALKAAPQIAIIQALDFKKYDSDKALTAEIAKLQNQGTRIIFLDCINLPGELLGKQLAMPSEWTLLPAMQRGFINRYMRKYAKADVFNFGTSHYVMLDYMPSTPAEYKGQLSPSYISRDFPFWEYRYLPLAKAVRDASGTKLPIISGNSADGKNLKITVTSPAAQAAKIAVEYKSFNRETDGKTIQNVQLNSGKQEIAIPLPSLPGGLHIAHIRLMDSSDKVMDAAAMRFDTPETAKAKISFTSQNRIYSPGSPVKFNVSSTGTSNSDKLEVTIEDSFFRTVYIAEKPAKAQDFTIELKAPYTILYRVFARIKNSRGEVIARTMEEFSVPGRKLDPTDFHAGMWGGRLLLSNMLRQYGFDMITVDGRRDFVEGTFRNITNLNCYPLILNLSWVANDSAANLKYRADIPSDPVRSPCYSDPAVTAAAEKGISKLLKNNHMNYYSGIYHMLGDEMYLGSTVCYSEHCLKGFREYLKKQYGSIAALNKVWGKNFASFENVVPEQRKAVEGSENLAPWLDHKMFMVNVWAHNFVGKRVQIIQQGVPGAMVGMSGTQVPGYSYDWAQLMKHLGCTAYYNGVQTTLVNQWQQPDSLSGQWGGGYVCSSQVYDIYQKSYQWSNLIKGANTAWNWHGSAYNGDGTATENLKSYCEEFNLLKSGLAKLLLTAKQNTIDVAVLYSQSSMFTAMAGGIGVAEWQNTQTGWEEILLDLKLNSQFITYENLADSNFDLSRFKIIVLPLTLSLSDAERERLVKFAENGGTVIADSLPGRYDSHGKRIAGTVLDKLFPGNSGKISPLMKNLNEPVLKGRFRVAEPELGTVRITPCGKGRGILCNVMFSSYQSLAIGGVGGETATAASGSQEYCLAMRNLISKLATESKVFAHAQVTGKNKQLVPCQSILKKAGENSYFAIVRHADFLKPGKIDHKNAPTVQVKLPVSGVIYDVRQGKVIANGNTFKIKAPTGYGQMFAILPAAITAVNSNVPARVKAGSAVKVTCSAAGAKSKTVYRMEVVNPDGTIAKEYSLNKCFDSPEGKFEFQIPFNATPGEWKVILKHVASGKSDTKPFNVVR